jgi:Domain of unknown function (DUF4116)
MSDLRARLSKITELHGQALAEAICQREPTSQQLEAAERETQLSNRDLVLRFAGADPTDGKSRTQWLVKTYIKDEHFKLEDLGRVDAALAAFERFKRKLPVEQREINHLKTLSALEALVDPFVKAEERARLTRDLSTATGRELRRLEEWKARDESIIIQEEKGLPTIAIPMTEFASKWWGRGTKWCTAAEKNNAFASYHKDAPLVIIICPDGDKFQANVTKENFQFMDNTDKKVSKGIIQERWDEFQSLFYWAVEQDGQTLHTVPENKKSPELCRLAVEQNGEALKYIPEKHRTPKLCRLAVEQTGISLSYVPEKLRTPELCRIAVEQNGDALGYVSDDYKTLELCRIAVQKSGQALRYAPEKYKTEELCRIAVEQEGWALRLVPKELKTQELCRLAIEQDGNALVSVPEDRKTSELYRMAVEQNGMALQYVSENQRTPELCRIAVEQDGMALRFVPINYLTLDLCRLAVEQNGWTLLSVPENKRSLELCRLAVEGNGEALKYMPGEFKTPELCRIAVVQNGLALKHVPEDQKTPELCHIAVEQNRQALQFVPDIHKTPEFLASIPPVQPKWNLDILQGLGNHSKPSYKSAYPISL